MMKLKAAAALVILVITNVFVFGGIAWNRSGEPTGRMAFNQCELNSFKDWSGPNRTVRYVSLDFESRKADEDSLENLFGPDWENKGTGKELQHRLYVVLKHGGPEWEEFARSTELRFGRRVFGRAESRLIIVNGDSDPERLLEEYPEAAGRAILPGYVGLRQGREEGVRDYFWNSASRRIAVDSRYRDTVMEVRDARIKFEKAARGPGQAVVDPPCAPSHRITVTWGRRFEPWISSIEAL